MLDSYRLPSPFERVHVDVGPLSVDPSQLTQIWDYAWADDNTVVFRNDLLSVAVHGVDRVEVDIAEGTHPEVAEAMLYGFAMRTLFLHSGAFSLHGSLLRFGRGGQVRTVAVAGHSGAGKSTSVTAVARRHGAEILVDDVLPLTVTADGVLAHPFARPVHLLPDAATRLGVVEPAVEDGSVVEGLGKFVCDLASGSGPIAVDHLVILHRSDPDVDQPLTIQEVRGAERLRLVVRHSNATGVNSFGARADAYLEWATKLASCLPTTLMLRRPGDDTLDDVVDHLVRILTSEN